MIRPWLFVLGFALALPAVADVAPPSGQKRVRGRLAFTNLGAFPDYRFVLVELSGPREGELPDAVLVEEGKPIEQISYRWFRPVLFAVKGPLPSHLGAVAEDPDAVSHLQALGTGPSLVPSGAAASHVLVTYEITGVGEDGITFTRRSVEGQDADGNPASLAGIPWGWPLGLAVGALGLLVAVVVWRKRKAPSAAAEPAA